MKRAWVVEMWNPLRDRWEPCADAAPAREQARGKVKAWQRRNPSDRFRAAKYVREDGA